MRRPTDSVIMCASPDRLAFMKRGGRFWPQVSRCRNLQHETPAQSGEIGVDESFDQNKVQDAYRRFYGDTVFSGAHHPLECALEFFGADHILFGTDMPWGAEGGEMFVRETIEAVKEATPEAAARSMLFEENALRVLGVK